MIRRKWDRWVVIVVLIMTFLMLLFLKNRSVGAQEKIPTDWQIYTDSSFGYQIAYPPDWEGQWMFDNQSDEEYVIQRRVAFFSPQGAEIDVDVWNNQESDPIGAWLREHRNLLQADLAQDQIVVDQQVSGFEAAQFEREKGKHYPAIKATYFTDGKFVFRIAYSAFDGGDASYIYKEMLSGFDCSPSKASVRSASSLPQYSPLGTTGDTCYGYTNFRTSKWNCQYSGSAGNCVWWAAYKRPDVGTCIWGNAEDWNNNAPACGLTVSSNPEVGSIAVLEAGEQGAGSVGHVVYVEQVDGNRFYVSQMNWDGEWMSHTWFNNTADTSFILVQDEDLSELGPFNFNGIKEHGAWMVWDSNDQESKRDGEIIQNGISSESGEVRGDSSQEWNEGLHYYWANFKANKKYRVSFKVKSLGGGDSHSPYVLLKSSSCETKGTDSLDVGNGSIITRSIEVTLGNCGDYYLVFGEKYAGSYLVDDIEIVEIQDSDPPTINFHVPTQNYWYNSDQTLSWNITDDDSGVDYFKWDWDDSSPDTQVNGSSGSTQLSDAGQGQHTLYVKAWDNEENVTSVKSRGWFGYDTLNPTLMDLTINDAAATTNQTSVRVNLTTSDTGSGVTQVRLSHNGLYWDDWQPYAAEVAWAIPALDRRELPVYAQVRDGAGNLSNVVSDTIALDLYPPMPHSANYRICDDVVDAGGSVGLTSNSYSLVSAIGQPWATGGTANASTGFAERGGFLANLDGCRPITHTVTDNFDIHQWVVASGGNVRGSASYQLGDTAGQPAASGANAFSSANYTLSSGFWGLNAITCPHPLTAVDITGPVTGTVDVLLTFEADIVPSEATTPLTYTWTPTPESGQGTREAIYGWDAAGKKSVMVEIENCGGKVSDSYTVDIVAEREFIYLPLVVRNQ